jgi:4-amino-4-deoxy-L-arabinose transferase-like glycosyltransferase
MADTIREASWTSPPTAEKVEQSSHKPLWQYLALGAIMLVSLFMNFYQLGQTGYGNDFYAASVRSMLDSWHNFFFVSFDPGGFVTVDKPPLGYWLQTLSAKLFGLTAFSVFFPQALAGVLSVLVVYKLVKDRFGVVAGLIAGLVLALSPISIITDRSNQVDSMLALVMLLGAWAVLKAAETGKLRWLLLCMVILGLGYNVKMLEAYMVIPAFGLLYLVGAPKSIWTRIWHLALAVAVLLVISLSWSVVVDMIPASQRPFVDSTQDNSEIGLAFGWNGVSRILGGGGPGGGRPGNLPREGRAPSTTGTGNGNQPSFPGGGNRGAGQQQRPGQGGPGGGPGGGGGFFGDGNPGPLRLIIGSLASQTAWFLPLALLGILAVAWKRRPRLQSDRQQQSTLMWGIWLISMTTYFSFTSGLFHQYYLTVMAPSIAAMSGIAIISMWQDYRASGWRGWLLPIAIALTAAEQIYILTGYPTYGKWLIPTISVLAALSVVVLIVARIIPRLRLSMKSVRYLVPALSFGMLALLLTPAVWSYTELSRSSGGIPSAGPDQGGGPGGGGPGNGGTNQANRNAPQRAQRNGDNRGGNNGGGPGGGGVNTKLVSYLEANQGNTKFLFAVTNSNSAAPYIIATNKPVMSLGGFLGSDPILNTTSLAKLVSNNTIRFFLLNGRAQTPNQQAAGQNNSAPGQNAPGGGPGGPGGGGGPGGQNSVTTWVQNHCTTVPTSEWQNSTSNAGGGFGGFGGGPGGSGNEQLYDCANTK